MPYKHFLLIEWKSYFSICEGKNVWFEGKTKSTSETTRAFQSCIYNWICGKRQPNFEVTITITVESHPKSDSSLIEIWIENQKLLCIHFIVITFYFPNFHFHTFIMNKRALAIDSFLSPLSKCAWNQHFLIKLFHSRTKKKIFKTFVNMHMHRTGAKNHLWWNKKAHLTLNKFAHIFVRIYIKNACGIFTV